MFRTSVNDNIDTGFRHGFHFYFIYAVRNRNFILGIVRNKSGCKRKGFACILRIFYGNAFQHRLFRHGVRIAVDNFYRISFFVAFVSNVYRQRYRFVVGFEFNLFRLCFFAVDFYRVGRIEGFNGNGCFFRSDTCQITERIGRTYRYGLAFFVRNRNLFYRASVITNFYLIISRSTVIRNGNIGCLFFSVCRKRKFFRPRRLTVYLYLCAKRNTDGNRSFFGFYRCKPFVSAVGQRSRLIVPVQYENFYFFPAGVTGIRFLPARGRDALITAHRYT